ncbi:hypothetical protein E4U55_007508 [Claviceps digitariae]|nr:hypothetical protein E4U55_007508 [Claviceps digitariae]
MHDPLPVSRDLVAGEPLPRSFDLHETSDDDVGSGDLLDNVSDQDDIAAIDNETLPQMPIIQSPRLTIKHCRKRRSCGT